MKKELLPVMVRDLPVSMVMHGGNLRPDVRSYVDQGVVRVIAGPESVHLIIDVKRPYERPQRLPRIGMK